MNIFTTIAKVIIGGFLALGSFLVGPTQPTQQPVSFGAYSPTGGGNYRTGQSIGTSDTTLKLSSFKEPVSGIPYTMSYLNSDIEYITISPQSSISEFASFSGISQNADGSATLTGLVRGLSRTPGTGGCVASTTLAQSHAGQSIVILSNPPCQLAEYLPLRTVATSSAATVIGSTTPWHYDFNPNFSSFASTSLVSKGYVDAGVLAGAAPITTSVAGIGLLSTAAQAALGTATSVFNAITYNLLLPNSLATSTPGLNAATQVPITIGGKIAQAFLDLTAAWTFSTTTTYNANFGRVVATSSIASYFQFASSTAITVSGTASTTNLFVSGTCTNCATNGYATVTNTGAGPTSADAQASVTASCSGSQKVVGGGASDSLTSTAPQVINSNPSGGNSWVVTYQGVHSNGNSANTMTAYAICVNP